MGQGQEIHARNLMNLFMSNVLIHLVSCCCEPVSGLEVCMFCD